ncbi:MAG TPA: hypothetical protein VIT63_01620 [Nitrospira sp.]
MSHPTEDARQADIVRLTKAAVEAAELGRWDIVIQCYEERGAMLEAAQEPVCGAEALLDLDEQIRVRVGDVQAVLISLLGEATATRQRLQGLRQRLGVLSSAPQTVSMEA